MKKKITAALMAAALICSGLCPATVKATETALPAIEDASLQEGEIVLVDNDTCTIKVKGYEEEDEWGCFGVKVFLENKTDQDLWFSVLDAYVDGFECDPYWSTSITAGKKANEELSFDLEYAGLEYAAVIDLYFQVYPDDMEWDSDPVMEDSYTIYPYGEEYAETCTYNLEDAYQILVDNDELTIAIDSIDPDNDFGFTMTLYILNKTDTECAYQINAASVNSYMVDPYVGISSVQGQKQIFSEVSWDSEELTENDIEDVEEVEMEIEVYECEEYEDIFDERFVVNP